MSKPIQEIKITLNRRRVGVKVEELIQMLRFADDIALITKNEKEMETALEMMQNCFEVYDMKNWKKLRL